MFSWIQFLFLIMLSIDNSLVYKLLPSHRRSPLEMGARGCHKAFHRQLNIEKPDPPLKRGWTVRLSNPFSISGIRVTVKQHAHHLMWKVTVKQHEHHLMWKVTVKQHEHHLMWKVTVKQHEHHLMWKVTVKQHEHHLTWKVTVKQHEHHLMWKVTVKQHEHHLLVMV